MGRQRFSRTGCGMTENEAYRNALNDAESESGCHDGYSGDMNSACDGDMKTKCIKKPKVAKRCKVAKNVQKGTRKWVTVYVIESKWSSRSDSRAVVRTSQGDAMKKAKEMALKSGEAMNVYIKKELDNGDNQVAEVSPNNSEQGIWRFSGTARC